MAPEAKKIDIRVVFLLDLSSFSKSLGVAWKANIGVDRLMKFNPRDLSKRPKNAAGPNVIRSPIREDVADFQFVQGATGGEQM